MLIISIVSAVCAFMALFMGLRRDMMMLQQNSNRNDRYIRWIRTSGESTRVPRLLCIIAVFLFLLSSVPSFAAVSIIGILSICLFFNLVSAKYKKPLVMTHRATRIIAVASVLALVLPALSFVLVKVWGRPVNAPMLMAFFFTLEFAVSFWLLLAANWLLQPVEKRINKKYYNEAADILASMPELVVVGVTGSYGKTSTKHYLYRILSEKYDVLMTPGNFNTTLGVIRTVREQMKPYTEVFIAEMGAKQTGDIKEICDLVHPSIGVITAVGPQHLESFKTMENVQATKFELADALPADGLAVLNDDFDFIADRPVTNTSALRYAVDANRPANYHAKDIVYTPTGTDFTIADENGDVISLHTRLVGRCNVSNLMAAVIVALRLQVPHDKIRHAVEKIDQVEHRLSIKCTPTGITIIDDAYNSNPVGSEMALEVLAGMSGGKRIIITPGMIELGDDQQRLNCLLGQNIAKSADLAIIVGEYNRNAILDGIDKGGMPRDRVVVVDSFSEAQQKLQGTAQRGDTVLYENDLPDTFK